MVRLIFFQLRTVTELELILVSRPGFPRLLESPDFFSKISRTCKVLENEFCPGKSWKLKPKILYKVLEFTCG